MLNEKIDILMATYNGQMYLREQIESILNQTYKNFNLYICDDCSSDNTLNILREYESKDDRVKVFVNNKNLGSTENFKKLLGLVKNSLYMFSDQDDIWNNDKIEKTYCKLVEENADLVFTDLTIVDKEKNVVNESFNIKKGYKSKILKTQKSCRLVHLYNVVTGCTILSKSKYIDKILGFKSNTKNILHDHIIPLVVVNDGKAVYLDESTMLYRQHEKNQVGAKRYIDRFNNFYDVRSHLIDVKIDIFERYIDNESLFSDDIKLLNKRALNFYETVKTKKYINFRHLKVFNELYKYEKLSYYILNFVVMNIPILGRFGYFIKSLIK